MRKLIVQEFVSADGFAADRDKTTSFFDGTKMHVGKEIDLYQVEFIKTIDTILLGKNTYEMFLEFWPNADPNEEPVADPLNSTNKLVVSTSLKEVSWGKWNNAAIINENIIDSIRELKSKPGKDIVVWGSLTLAKSLFKAKLVDELHVLVCPVAIGKGYHFISEDEELMKLKLLANKTFTSSVVSSVYQVIQ
ncbi:dihydrofolate reductase family protein [Sphingobacterium sp. 1.A.5]|jgi:dihydrofolate reductase|uniref:dihydrofolate reductase family protein n=1 Tax=Sphingobacterium sp. 1.A.5 TaxID=2044604 RepID=UPI000C0BF47E|nr:dihydrofolate reductase family protein [Sphingobacterium sp. 1.A.5]